MGIKERMLELQAQQRAAEEEAGRQREERERVQRERYSRELPEAILEQRMLFEELQAIGVIGLLEEMTDPGKILPLLTPEEQREASGRVWDAAKFLPKGALPAEEVRKVFDAADRQKWQGGMVYPKMLEDGSADTTLRLEFNDDTLRRTYREHKPPLKSVFVSYSQERVLTTQGAEVTFEVRITKEDAGIDAIEYALARAFLNPHVKKEPHDFAHQPDTIFGQRV